MDLEVKVCPECAEEVPAGARLCRYCVYDFAPASEAAEQPSATDSQTTAPGADLTGEQRDSERADETTTPARTGTAAAPSTRAALAASAALAEESSSPGAAPANVGARPEESADDQDGHDALSAPTSRGRAGPMKRLALWTLRALFALLVLLDGWSLGLHVFSGDPPRVAGLPGVLVGMLIGIAGLCVVATITWCLRGRGQGRRWWRSVLGIPQLLSMSILLTLASHGITAGNQTNPACAGLVAFESGNDAAATRYTGALASQRLASNLGSQPKRFSQAMAHALQLQDQSLVILSRVATAGRQQERMLADVERAMKLTRHGLVEERRGALAGDLKLARQGDDDVAAAQSMVKQVGQEEQALIARCG